MFNFQECGETIKASLEPDDIDAVCAVYPRENDPGECEPVQPSDPGCCSTGGGAPGAAGLALVTFLAAAGRRRRSRG
jgi:MYXO-CTERM domain-containing protein